MQNFEINMKKEYILAGDISGSMNTVDAECDNLTRYNFMLEKFKKFIKIACDFDTHEGGVTVFLFGKEVQKFEHTTLENIEKNLKNFEFEGMTNTDLLIEQALEEHQEERAELRKEGKFHPGTCLMIFTDGVPTNPANVKRVIQDTTRVVDNAEEFSIVFLTVGTMLNEVTQYLNDLTTLPNVKHQIVSVKRLEDVDFISAATE